MKKLASTGRRWLMGTAAGITISAALLASPASLVPVVGAQEPDDISPLLPGDFPFQATEVEVCSSDGGECVTVTLAGATAASDAGGSEVSVCVGDGEACVTAVVGAGTASAPATSDQPPIMMPTATGATAPALPSVQTR